MANNPNKDFKHDPEAEDNVKKYRLPFALCKSRGIETEDWWTPIDAWEALQEGGFIEDVSDEYKKYYRKLKKEKSKIYRERAKRKEQQLKEEEHNPDYEYKHQKGAIAGAKKEKPMTHEEADSGNVNPYYRTSKIGYRHNCQTCIATYFARLMGYNVRALPNLNNKNIFELSIDTALAFVDENGKHPEKIKQPSYTRTEPWLLGEMEENETCSIQFTYVGRKCGHIITCRKENGKIKYYDPQTNNTYDNLSAYGAIEGVKIMHLQKYKLDEEFCDKIMKKVV